MHFVDLGLRPFCTGGALDCQRVGLLLMSTGETLSRSDYCSHMLQSLLFFSDRHTLHEEGHPERELICCEACCAPLAAGKLVWQCGRVVCARYEAAGWESDPGIRGLFVAGGGLFGAQSCMCTVMAARLFPVAGLCKERETPQVCCRGNFSGFCKHTRCPLVVAS